MPVSTCLLVPSINHKTNSMLILFSVTVVLPSSCPESVLRLLLSALSQSQ